MHGMLAAHLGMRMRLLEALDTKQMRLVKDSEGVIVHIVVHPDDQELVPAAMANGDQQIYLRHLLLGIWLRMDKFDQSPFGDILGSDATNLVFIEPRTSDHFLFRNHKVRRTAFPLSLCSGGDHHGLPGPHHEGWRGYRLWSP